jgi:hypothetical protein
VILGPPREDPVLLTHRPQVLSWDRADTWAQQRLVPYRDEIAARLGPTVASLGAVAFDLSIGFGPTSDLEVVGDLDNYLAPVAEALGRDRIVAAWGSKDTGQSSTLAVGSPRNLAPDALADFQHATARTTGRRSSRTTPGGRTTRAGSEGRPSARPTRPAAARVKSVVNHRPASGDSRVAVAAPKAKAAPKREKTTVSPLAGGDATSGLDDLLA